VTLQRVGNGRNVAEYGGVGAPVEPAVLILEQEAAPGEQAQIDDRHPGVERDVEPPGVVEAQLEQHRGVAHQPAFEPPTLQLGDPENGSEAKAEAQRRVNKARANLSTLLPQNQKAQGNKHQSR